MATREDRLVSASSEQTQFEESLRADRARREQRKAERSGRRKPKGNSLSKAGQVGHATDAQRTEIASAACVHCHKHAGACHPAHLIPRAVTSQEAANDQRMTIPLCPVCHREYDEGKIDLSAGLEPHWRDAVECAVGAVGLWSALRYIAGPKTLGEIAQRALDAA